MFLGSIGIWNTQLSSNKQDFTVWYTLVIAKITLGVGRYRSIFLTLADKIRLLFSLIISLILYIRVSPNLPTTPRSYREIYPRNTTERRYLVLPKSNTK
jgi:hypothetical protein